MRNVQEIRDDVQREKIVHAILGVDRPADDVDHAVSGPSSACLVLLLSFLSMTFLGVFQLLSLIDRCPQVILENLVRSSHAAVQPETRALERTEPVLTGILTGIITGCSSPIGRR